MTVILAALLVLASPATAKDPKDRMWMALKRVECGNIRAVIWREVDDPTDYYATTEFRRPPNRLNVSGNDRAAGSSSEELIWPEKIVWGHLDEQWATTRSNRRIRRTRISASSAARVRSLMSFLGPRTSI